MDAINLSSLLPLSTRSLSTAIIGQTGYGKTNLLKSLVVRDIENGISCIVMDAMGDLSNELFAHASTTIPERTILLQVDPDFPFGLNLYECPNYLSIVAIDRTVDMVMQLFRKLWNNDDLFFPRIEYVIRNTARTIIANPGYTMLEVPLLFSNKPLRDKLVAHVKNQEVLQFWRDYEERNPRLKTELTESSILRISQFLQSEFISRVVSQSKTTIPFADVLANPGMLLIISIPIGELGEGVTEFIGSVFLSVLTNLVYEREKLLKSERNPVSLYLDEYSRFASTSSSALLKQGRQFGVNTTVAFQTLSDLKDQENRSAVLQTGSSIAFQVIGGEDAELVAKQMSIQPMPIEKKLQLKTEPVYQEWDEWYWESEEAQKHDESLQVLIAKTEQNIQEARRCVTHTRLRLECAQALKKHFINVFRINAPTTWHCDITPSFQQIIEKIKSQTDEYETRAGTEYLNQPLNPCWIQYYDYAPQYSSVGGMYAKPDLPQDELDAIAGSLMLSAVENGEKQSETYLLTDKATVTWLEYMLVHHPHPRVHNEDIFAALLNDFVQLIHVDLAKMYEGLSMKFRPHSYAHLPIGQARSGSKWMERGNWEALRLSPKWGWLISLEKYLETLRETCSEAMEKAEQELILCEHQLTQLQHEQQAWKAEYYKSTHHSKYIGERPIVETKIHTSSSHTKGETERLNMSRYGDEWLPGRSESISTTEAPYDTQLYEWVDGTLRSYADMRNELETELANLPRFTCIIQSVDNEGKTQKQTVQLPPPQTFAPDREAIERIKQDSLHRYGRPWDEVQEEIRQRQYIPPQEEGKIGEKPGQEKKPPPERGKPFKA